MRATDYYKKLTTAIAHLDLNVFDQAVELIAQTFQQEKQVICFGNGGSALAAQHFITDWNKSISHAWHKPFRGRSLTENIGLLTAYANDVSYQDIFVEQLKTVLQAGDLVIGISGSGQSENVLRAIRYANQQGCTTIGLCGFDGGQLKALAHCPVWVAVQDMQIVEDIHLTFGHCVMQSLCHSAKTPSSTVCA